MQNLFFQFLDHKYKLDQRYVIKCLVAKKYKPYMIYWKMYDVSGEVLFSQNIFSRRVNLFQVRRNIIEDINMPDISTISTPAMVDLVNELVLSDRRVRIQTIDDQLRISVGIVQ